MIKLHVFGPAFGVADPSPFIVKAHVLLRMAGLTYEAVPADFKKAPKSKFPIIEDDGEIVPDSTLIRFHIEKKYGFDFDKGVSPEACGAGWAFEKLCEDNLYWAALHDRWLIDANFERGPKKFFDSAPALIRPLILAMVRRKVRKNLESQGNGRYSPEERFAIGQRGIRSIADYLATRDFIGGDAPCGSDASVYGMVTNLLTPFFDSPLSSEAQKLPALAAYAERMKARYFADTP